jgi:hypothetical protein
MKKYLEVKYNYKHDTKPKQEQSHNVAVCDNKFENVYVNDTKQ